MRAPRYRICKKITDRFSLGLLWQIFVSRLPRSAAKSTARKTRLFISLQILILKLLLLATLGLSGCAGAPPIEEYTLAYTAMTAAKYAEGSRFAPGLWYKAEDAYGKAKRYYDDREYPAAKRYFNLAIQFAERAENSARLSRMQSGEVFP